MDEIRINNFERRQFISFLLLFIIVLAIFIRVIALYNSDNFHGIAAGKVFSAQNLIKHPDRLYSWVIPAHGPIHIYMITLVLKLFNDPLFSPRLISLFAGIAFVGFYYKYIKAAFNAETALVSTFIAALFPLHILHSVLSTAEASFLLFMIIGLFYLEQSFAGGEEDKLVYSAIFLSLSSMCRFEGGLFILIAAAFLLRQPKKLFLFLSVASVLPVIWMICNYIYGGNPLLFLSASDSIVQTEFQYLRHIGQNITFAKKLFYWPLQLCDYFGWPVAFIGLIGILKARHKRNKRSFYLFVFMIGFFAYKTIKEELAMQPRYGLSLAMLFIPFFSLMVLETVRKMPNKQKAFVITGFALFILFRSTYFTAISLPRTPFWVVQAGEFLHQNLKGNDAVFVEADEDNFKEPLKLQARVDRDIFVDQNHFFRHIELVDPMSGKDMRYLVLISERSMHNLKKVFQSGDCKIYDVSR